MDFKKPPSPILTPQDLMKYIDDPKYCHEDIESSSALKHGVSILHTYVTLIIHLMCALNFMTYVTQFAKMTHFGNPDFCINEFHKPNALFCSNINAILQIFFELQG